MFPYLKLKKQNKKWTVRMAIGKELDFYQYPFFLTEEFLIYKDKYDMEIKLQFIQSFSVSSLEKKFDVEDFFNQFSIPNQKRTEVKKRIIELFDELKNHKLIDTQFRIVQKNGLSTTVKQLTPLLLTKSQNIFFHEIIHSNF